LITDAWGALELDGEKLIEGEGGGQVQVSLAQGLHRLTVRAAFPQDGVPFTLAWGRSDEQLIPIPAEVLGR
jgi:hypothetical protein